MISMKRLLVGSFAALALLASAAMAQSKADATFAAMDTNKDGKISAEEYAAAAKARFDKMDRNKAGKIVIADQMKTPTKARGHATAQAEAAMDMLRAMDANGDGIVTAEEYVAAARAQFEKMDTNKDGFVSKAEWDAAHRSPRRR